MNSSSTEAADAADQVAALQAQVRGLQARLRSSEAKVAMWEEACQQLVHCIVLSPDMNEYYSELCTELLTGALSSVEQISQVRFVECSFPSVPNEAPHIQLERWESLADSEWQFRWAPSWSVQVAVEGSQYMTFSLMIRLFDLRVAGRIKVRMSPDLSSIGLMFTQLPKLRLKTECSISLGSVPLPLQTYIESVVQEEFRTWLIENVVTPNEMVLNPEGFQPKDGLTPADYEKAVKAAAMAKSLSRTSSSST